MEIDAPYEDDPSAECERCIRACPSGTLSPFKLEINRCLAYASENPGGVIVPDNVRALERKLIVRSSPYSFIECTSCIFSCSIGG